MKKIPTELAGDRILIRRLRRSDAEAIYQNIKNRDVSRWLLTVPYPYPKDGAVKYIRKSKRQWQKRTNFFFAICLEETGELLGGGGLKCVDDCNQRAEMGYWLGKKHWNQGLATEAAGLFSKFAFEHLKLHRVYAHIFESNVASGRVLEKCGFSREGVWREARVKYNRRQNLVFYAILKPEYEKMICQKGIRKK